MTSSWSENRDDRSKVGAPGNRGVCCNPKSPWQRGSNENTNRLLRQYLPRGADLRALSAEHLNELASRINTRPRRVLGWDTAAARFQAHLVAVAGA